MPAKLIVISDLSWLNICTCLASVIACLGVVAKFELTTFLAIISCIPSPLSFLNVYKFYLKYILWKFCTYLVSLDVTANFSSAVIESSLTMYKLIYLYILCKFCTHFRCDHIVHRKLYTSASCFSTSSIRLFNTSL